MAHLSKNNPEIPLPDNYEALAGETLRRMLPRIPVPIGANGKVFRQRLEKCFPELFAHYYQLYGRRYDFYYHFEQLLLVMSEYFSKRSSPLKKRDTEKQKNPGWFRSEKMIGGVCYVDLYAGDLKKMEKKIPYFKKLGITYLHLMPFFKCPEEESDGGYAVSSYREVRDDLGVMDDLEMLAASLHKNGINLVVDFINNHTSDEFEWAQKALQGDEKSRDYYYLFPDRTIPDAFDRTLREIFPDVRRGSFNYREEIDSWVWTTFHNYQWDLNYRNPETFTAIAGELLALANRGVDVLRMDAVAFTWKRMGTDCENLPEAHLLLKAFNRMAEVVCPSLLLKSEAIVHPDEVNRYIGADECRLSYNPLLMALSWEALATRKTELLVHSMKYRFKISEDAAWVNYVRSHDDIGWTFSDEDAAGLGINGYDHRQFLNRFYSGQFPGSFARGVPFQYNPENHDMRICGSCASLTGLEKGLAEKDDTECELSLARMKMMYGIAYSIGGIPLIYLGDEWAALNDYNYSQNSGKAHDSRWVHRQDLRKGMKSGCVNSRCAGKLQSFFEKLGKIRAAEPALGKGSTNFPDPPSPHLFMFIRRFVNEQIFVITNFSEHRISVHGNQVRIHLEKKSASDLLTGREFSEAENFVVEPYELLWIK